MKKYWWILIVVGVVILAVIIGIPKTELPVEEHSDEELHPPVAPSDVIQEPEYTVPPFPDAEQQEPEEQFDTEPLERVVPLTPEQEKILQTTNYNAYIRYRARMERNGRKEKMTPEEILERRVAPKLKAHLEKNS